MSAARIAHVSAGGTDGMACRRAGTGPGTGDDAAVMRMSRVTGRRQGRARVQSGWDRRNADRDALSAHGAT